MPLHLAYQAIADGDHLIYVPLHTQSETEDSEDFTYMVNHNGKQLLDWKSGPSYYPFPGLSTNEYDGCFVLRPQNKGHYHFVGRAWLFKPRLSPRRIDLAEFEPDTYDLKTFDIF